MDNMNMDPHNPCVSGISVGLSQDSEMMDAEDELGPPISEDDDSLGEDEAFSSSNLLQSALQDDTITSLTAAGTMPGLAAAAAVVTARKRQRPYKFETNPSTRRRQHTRLLRKLKKTIREFCTRCGQQAIVMSVSPGKDNPSFKVFGASPLDKVVRNSQSLILRDLERILQEQTPAPANRPGTSMFELPALMIDGIPTPVDKMNQAQLRMFIPEMLKYSTGRGKPGWGKEPTKPAWWPPDVPWANVRRDVRTDDQKLKVSWTQALRQIVKNCYKFHGRDDLLHCFSDDSNSNPAPQISIPDRFCLPVTQTQTRQFQTPQMNLNPPTLVQTVQNSDGSVSLVQLDSGQTIATITQDQSGAAVATLSAPETNENQLAVTMHQVGAGQWTATPDNQPGTSGIQASVAENTNGQASVITQPNLGQPPQVIVETSTNGLQVEDKFGTNIITQHQLQPQNSHTIGITIDSNGQAVATLQNANLPPGSQIVIAPHGRPLDDPDSAAMVHIPVSVYEKLAKSIQDAHIGNLPTMSSQRVVDIDVDAPQ